MNSLYLIISESLCYYFLLFYLYFRKRSNKLGTDANDRPIETVIHLHGKAAAPYYDGYAEDFILPDYYKDYHYNNHRAAIFWYHDHAHSKTARNVYMGLAGMYIVEEAEELNLNLPKDKYDLPLIIQDKKFDCKGQLVFDTKETKNIYGDVILVNGIPWPRLKVARRKYRFRVLNASASRRYSLSLSRFVDAVTPDEELIVLGSDGGLLDKPVTLNTTKEPLLLGVAERYDVIIDFSKYQKGQEVFLRNIGFSGITDNDTRTHAIMCFEVDRDEVDNSAIPSQLCESAPVLTPAELSNFSQIKERKFRFDRNNNEWKINNKPWILGQNRNEAEPEAGAVEIWTLINSGGGWVHPVHIHLIDVRILERNGKAPRSYESGRKDVIQINQFETVRVVARFNKPDLDGDREFLEGKYMLHCHNLVHEDYSMMAVFEVGINGLDPVTTAPAKPIEEMTPLGRG